MPRFDELDNWQGCGDTDGQTGTYDNGYGNGLTAFELAAREDMDRIDPSYVALVRKEASMAGVELPSDDTQVVRFAARAALEAS